MREALKEEAHTDPSPGPGRLAPRETTQSTH
jgi:hypothetical protein